MNFARAWSVTLLLVLAVTGSEIARSAPRTVSISGYVIDSACAFTKDLRKPVSPVCAIACAHAGSPLVILSDHGAIYWPISNTTPASGQNPRLMSYAGKRVTVKGKVYEKGGSRAIVIETIEAAK